VDIVNRFTNLLHDWCHFALWNWFRFFELMLQLSSGTSFQDDVDIVLVIEKTVQFDDVRVI
jgi:hypothetical protein